MYEFDNFWYGTKLILQIIIYFNKIIYFKTIGVEKKTDDSFSSYQNITKNNNIILKI